MGAIISFDEYYSSIEALLSAAKTDKKLFEAIVNAPFHDKFHATNFDLGMIVMALVNKKTQTIDRIAHSNTTPALDAVNASLLPFKDIKIPLNIKDNATSRAIQAQIPQHTSDWRYLFTPIMSTEAARLNQAEAGMDCSYIFPFKARDGGVLIFSFYQISENIKKEHQDFMNKYTKLVNKILSTKQGK